ncbi:NAD-dependent epimerase/dehydratase family protein [Elusimicrobiota bacterium]
MKVLVTGGNGFVGSHIVEELLKNNHKVVCLVRKTANLQWLQNLDIEYKYGSITDNGVLADAVRDVDAIIHCAAVLRSAKKDYYYQINQIVVKNLAKEILKHKLELKKFIYISSQAVMGPAKDFTPKKVGDSETPISDYGKSKLAGEKELKLLDGKIPYTILRPASVYGPRDKDIMIFFQAVNSGFCPFTFRKRYFQLLYVKDLASAAVKSLTKKSSDYKTYFLADEKPYLWKDIGKEIALQANKKVFPLLVPGFVFRIVAFIAEIMSRLINKPAVLNNQKISEMLQFYWIGDNTQTKRDLDMDFTNFKIGAKITNQWYKENNWF